MPPVIITGGPGAGKTTLLTELAAMGYATVDESARAIIAERVFVLPPWDAIYATDAERDQSFAEAVAVRDKVASWYRSCAYVLNEVPRLPVTQRAEHVLRTLAESAA